MSQVADRFYAAVRKLATEGPVKQRLINAYVGHLEALGDHEVPEVIRPRYEILCKAMTAVPSNEKETSVQVSVRKMSEADAARYARSILVMFAELIRVKSTGERLHSGDTGKFGVVELHSAAPRPPTLLSR
ncbi:MAG: hypothetical protein OEV14_00880 [Gammaproteobacteria bacterium]|nr:hypothetical protein [Gammaproteobacteria bacterium]